MSASHNHAHPAHGHGHGHVHAHHHHAAASAALPWALALTLGFAAVEAVAGWWSGSLALLGDAGHMLTDSLALAMATVAARVARRPASARHSYGLRRLETLAGLVNGLSMLPVVALIGWHAVGRLFDPQPVHGETVMAVALVGLAINLVVAWMLSRGTGDLNTRGALLHVMGDALGSVAALTAGVVIHFTGWYPIDPLLSMLICVLILVSTFQLLRSATHMLLEGVPEALSLPDVGRSMATVAGVRSVHDLHIWNLDSKHIALSAHVVLRNGDEWPKVLGALRAVLHSRFAIDHVTLQPETLPDQPLTFAPRRAPRDADTR